MLQHDGGEEGLAPGSSTKLVAEGVAVLLTPGAFTSGSKEDIACSITENTDLTMVDIENADLQDLSLAQLILAAAGRGLNIKVCSASAGANLLPLKRWSKEMAEGVTEEETMESKCTKWSAACAENAILVHRILSSQSCVDMLQPALAGALLSAHPAVCDAVSWGSNFDVSIGVFTGVPVTRDTVFRLEQLINAHPASFCNMQRGSGAQPYDPSAPPSQYQSLEEMMQQVKKLKSEIAEIKRSLLSSCASFAPELSSSGAVNPLANVCNASNHAPAVVALHDLLSVFENFVPAAGTGSKENLCVSGWNSYASFEPHRFRYVYSDDPEDFGLAISRSTTLLHSGASAEPGLLVWVAVLQDKQHAILLDMNEGRPPEKFASAEANFFKIVTELLQTSKVCEIKAGVEGAEEGRNRQLANFAMIFNQAQEHMQNHVEVMGCGDTMYSQNMCMLVGAAFGTSMDARHMKKMKVTAELH
eukprot:488774-Rhodomonas_salina.1